MTVIWKTRHKQVVMLEVPPEIPVQEPQDRNVIWKDYFEKRFFRYLFRPSLACREWRNYILVGALGIPVAKPLGMGEYRRGLRLTRSYLLSRRVMDCADGRVFYADGERAGDRCGLLEFAGQNLRLLARLHAAGYVHGGFHPLNELFYEEEGHMKIVWIDLATVKKPHFWQTGAGREQDLKMFLDPLGLSAEEEEELMRVYTDALAGYSA